ncbi:UDP-N-acetylmuramoylalanine--D-glutamate ligase [bioreactor metagenome]|uniref:UDP-N-acetylmuramoylalanine--D-glutamate ligase n=2 Tax=root TaxID=1 RepID=A0A645A022_9ZZZZ
MASGIVAKLLDISDDNLRLALSDFKGVPHRLEKVASVRGVQYINDSKATNVNSCWYALQSMRTKVVLILGGTDKGNDYTEIEELVRQKARGLIFLGKDNRKLRAFFDGIVPDIEEVNSMKDAVDTAYRMAEKGDTVLLSPCCASFDLFQNYEDRGNQFKDCVRRL